MDSDYLKREECMACKVHTHRQGGFCGRGSVAPTGSQASPVGATERPLVYVCIFFDIELFFILKKCSSFEKMRSRKEKQILEFVEKHGGAPLQRTPAWISLRRSVVGASELAALVGMSPYDNFESIALKKQRIYYSSFATPACWWGTIFEDVAVKFAEREFATKIHGTNICVKLPEDSPLHEKHVVSPDGYGVVEFC